MIYQAYNGRDAFVSLAEEPYSHIAPKAFLSCKSIESLKLPMQLESIGDWAFAHMHHLTDLYLPPNPIVLGKQIFLDCEKLKCIHIMGDTSGNKGLPYFMGAAITIFQKSNLLQPHLAGNKNTHASWLAQFDDVLTEFISADDSDGFEPVFYGWFNDDDVYSTQLPQFIHKKRSSKLYLAFLRLRYPLYLQAPLKNLLQHYLTDHMPEGRDSHQHIITWELLPEYCRDELTYIQLLEQAGGITSQNIPSLIRHLSDACPEVLAYLLHLQSTYQENDNFFDHFSI